VSQPFGKRFMECPLGYADNEIEYMFFGVLFMNVNCCEEKICQLLCKIP